MFLCCFVFIMIALSFSFMLHRLQLSMTAGQIILGSNAEPTLHCFLFLSQFKYFEIVGRY